MTINNHNPKSISEKLDRVLLKVEKPGRYVGGEYNQVVKEWNQVTTKIALAFPDIYDIGLSNLGLTILYEILNAQKHILAERVYIPWKDMESLMRSEGIPLYTLETRHPVADFDILGITLPYETLFTNTLNLLDLSGIPVFAAERTQDHPLVIAGGHACFNPEPMAPFIDAFLIGEGEEAILEIAETYAAWKSTGKSRRELLKTLASIWGVYVPSLYQPVFAENGKLDSISPLDTSAPAAVTKRLVRTLPPPPVKFLVPSIDIVHNRITIEIMRGCTRGCRFCHAGMVNRPVRQRPVHQIVEAIEAAIKSTGYEEVGLLSLSSSDYTHIVELVENIRTRFSNRKLTIALPSLRIESFSLDLLENLKGSRQGGFTLAPEAATERMRNTINKPISSEQLLATAREIYQRGWQTIKLYFMIGHPGETEKDVMAIADLCLHVIKIGHQELGRRAALHVSVGTFVPKPHTPFQWAAVNSPAEIEAKQSILKQMLKKQGIKLNWTTSSETMLESWLARGDRRLADVIFTAWKNGATFDAWHESDHIQTWKDAFTKCGIDPDEYAAIERGKEEFFPWDVISTGVSKNFLRREYEASKNQITTSDCRETCHACGIVPVFGKYASQENDSEWFCPVPQNAAGI